MDLRGQLGFYFGFDLSSALQTQTQGVFFFTLQNKTRRIVLNRLQVARYSTVTVIAIKSGICLPGGCCGPFVLSWQQNY